MNNVGIYLRDEPFESDPGNVSLYPSKGKHWVAFPNENYFDSYGCAPPHELYKFIIKRNGHFQTSEYEIQGLTNKEDSYCASY